MTHFSEKRVNLVLIALLILITAFTVFYEGYVSLISTPFLLALVAGCAVAVWLAGSISTRRLLALILGIFIIEYIKETIGMVSGMWTYHAGGGQYNFGVWAWVLGGLVAYTVSIKIVIRLIRKLKFRFPGWLNQVLVVLAGLLVWLLLGDYRHGAGTSFYLFYILLFVLAFYVSFKMDFPVLAGIVVSAWIVGGPSEYMGSVASGVWTFTYDPHYPPLFLLLGCWPLEILAQYSLSAFLANEPLDKYTN